MRHVPKIASVLALAVPLVPSAAQTRGPTIEALVVHANASPPRVEFTLSWANGWRNERNHDAAWVVLRGPDASRAPLRLGTGHDAWGDGVAAVVRASDDALGVFVAPAGPHRGDVRWRVSLGLQEAPPDAVHAWAVGMVFVPAGAFDVGDDDPLVARFGAFRPLRVASEAALDVGEQAGGLWYEGDRSGYRGDRQGPVPAAFPKGTRAFYVMKHELTQGEYAAFVDALPAAWQRARAPLDLQGEETETCSIAEVDGHWRAATPARPCNFVSWDDTCALFDWLALRPMTEFEFEKAARGPQRPVSGDYPWGTAMTEGLARKVERTRDLTRADVAAERALADATRHELGASHYWVMDLAGSVWERVVSAGQPAGRAFTGSHGDGVLDEQGCATNADWPHTAGNGEEAPGVGYRGGAEYFVPSRPNDPTNPYSPVAVRTYGGWGGAQRYKTYSARACRTAAAGDAARVLPVDEAKALAAELLQRRERDQAMRTRDIDGLPAAERHQAFDEWSRVDGENTARMIEVVRTFGWPTYAMVGKAASDAAFLLVQHADHEPAFQAECLPLLQAAAARGEAAKQSLAYLTDRVRVKQRRPQLYATQYLSANRADGSADVDASGRVRYVAPVVEDTDRLDARRAAMGLGAWAGYEGRMAELQKRAPWPTPQAWDGRLPVADRR